MAFRLNRKRVFSCLAAGCLIPLMLLLAAALTPVLLYRGIVRHEPGGMYTGVTPGTRGAQVNVFSGTGGWFYLAGYNTPAACVPFGMVRLGPDTASMLIRQRALNPSGYYYGDNAILGFSHTRLVGADAEEGGHLRVLPTVASRAERLWTEREGTRFSHVEETGFPGYYAVRLPKERVRAELTVTPRTGVHRYTFEPDAQPYLLVDVTSMLGDRRAEEGYLWIDPDSSRVEGSVTTKGSFSGRYGGITVYFAGEFSAPFDQYGVWSGNAFSPGDTSGTGNDIGAGLQFAATPEEQAIELRLALSYVSKENARENLRAEALGRPFKELAEAARDQWETRLGCIRIEGGTEEHRRIFRTSLYRAFQMPTTFTDVNSEYRGFDKEVHTAEDFVYYTDFSLWDSFRTVHPLYSLVARPEQRDMMRSLMRMLEQGGALPRWPSGCGYTNCMFGTPADLAVSEAYLKGIRGFDIEAAYQAMRHTALVGRPEESRFRGRSGLPSYLALGYCASDKMSKAVARTLEYASADYAIALLAQALGHGADAEILAKHAQFYRNLWNPETNYFQPRDSAGHFEEPFKPLQLSYTDFDNEYTDDYVEGSPLQWRWAVPHDPEGLVGLFPSRARFVEELDTFFEKAPETLGPWNPGSYYWHGNEPDIHAVYLFNAAGRPGLSQKWVRWILEHKYADNYVGLDGNDDGGTLSAWFVFSALGFYPVAGTPKYQLGAPLFERAEVDMGNGKTLTVTAENAGPDHIYARRVWLNGKPLERTWFTHDEIADGGELRFEMRAEPAT